MKSENKKTKGKERKDSKATKKVTNIRGGNKTIFLIKVIEFIT